MKNYGARIRVGDAKLRQNGNLAGLHRFGVGLVIMIMAHQVQQTMHPQMDKVIIEGFVVAYGFGPDCLECDGDLASSKAALTVSLGLAAWKGQDIGWLCLLYTSPSPRDRTRSRMPSSA